VITFTRILSLPLITDIFKNLYSTEAFTIVWKSKDSDIITLAKTFDKDKKIKVGVEAKSSEYDPPDGSDDSMATFFFSGIPVIMQDERLKTSTWHVTSAPEPTPEPSAVLSLLALGGLGLVSLKRKQS
jgi:hypothetical protein